MWQKVLLAVVCWWPAVGLLAAEPKTLLLLGQSPDGHPPGTHEYMAGANIMAKLLADVPGLKTKVVRADSPWKEGPALLKEADGAVIFLSQGAKWIHDDPARLKAFQDLAERGGGLVCLHWAMGTRPAEPIGPFVKLFGACHGGPDRKFLVVEDKLQVVAHEHPVTSGVEGIKLREEFYFRLKTVQPEGSITPLLQVPIKGNLETVAWAWQRPDGGRSFGFTGLHFHANWHHVPYQRLVTQGILWSMKLPVPKSGIEPNVSDDDIELKRAAKLKD